VTDIHDRLVSALSEQGFYRSGERLIAPNGTLWVSRPMLELEGLDGLRYEARRRLGKKLRQRKSYESTYDWQCALEDVESLLVALDGVHAPSETAVLAEAS
jgi:hypothetical protein